MMSSGVLCPHIHLHGLADADAAEEEGGVAQAAGDYGGSSYRHKQDLSLKCSAWIDFNPCH